MDDEAVESTLMYSDPMREKEKDSSKKKEDDKKDKFIQPFFDSEMYLKDNSKKNR